MFLKKSLQLLLVFLLPAFAMAQVTTSSIVGTVTTSSGAALEGASIKAIHTPSGTSYATFSRGGGNFTIPNMRVGGPYTLEISYVGFTSQKVEDITLRLGESFNIAISLKESQGDNAVVIVTSAKTKSSLKTGANTVISSKMIGEMPTISRSITDLTKLTPQANGNSFAGRDGRYNNLQVDGVNLNNNFGLSSDLAPGSGNPISMDALSEVSVNIAPFDVRQSGFTGAGINVITKSGTNKFHGTVYGLNRNQNDYGYKVNGSELSKTPSQNSIIGASVGGPIIKNKLFFFINAESEKSSIPGITYVASGSSNSGNPSSTTLADLKTVYNFVKNTYGYDLGAYDNFPNFDSKNRKLLAKLDWNINTANKLTLKYTDYKGNDVSPMNGSSVPQNGTIYVTGQSKGVSRLPNNRFGSSSMAFGNSNYQTNHIVQTGSLELNSRISNQLSNQFLATYTHVSDIRQPIGGKVFPTVDIFNGAGQNYISLGTDPFTNNNQLLNNILNFTDNITYYAGAHTITGGVSFEKQKVGNMFMGGSQGHYVFNSLNDFLTQQQPVYYGYTYSVVPGQKAVFSANLVMSQLGVYLQDEYKVNQNFKLTYGLRVDMPIYGAKPIDNPAIDALELPNADGKMIHYNTGAWPKNSPLFSPRVGFNWDVKGDGSLIVRGGTGIFSGRIPFVFLTNMPSNSGVYQNAVYLNSKAQLDAAGVTKFDPNIDAYDKSSAFPKQPQTTTPPKSFVVIDPNFKFPQVWRTNLGADKDLGNGFKATIDLMYTKDLKGVVMRNPNLKAPTAHFTGTDQRSYYDVSPLPTYYNNLGTPIVLENTSKGHSLAATAQISKSFSNGWFASVAYTYTAAKEVSPNPGSRATSAWQSIYNVNGPNSQVLGNSQYAVPSRIVGNLSYTLDKGIFNLPSTFSLYYEGTAQGKYSYVTNGSMVGDGNSNLIYIYKSGADVPFVATSSYTVAQQQAAYDQFVASSKYLSKHKGQYADRNAATTPWFNEVDVKFVQDLFVRRDAKGAPKNELQFTVDIFNFPNMLNSNWKNWGYKQMYSINNPLVYKGVDANGAPTFNMNTYNGALATDAYTTNKSLSSTYSMQLGLRFTF